MPDRVGLVLVVVVVVGLVSLADALKLVESPQGTVWLDQGQSRRFACESSSPWQWCYWEVVTRDPDGVRLTSSKHYVVNSGTGPPAPSRQPSSVLLRAASDTVCEMEMFNVSAEAHQVHIVFDPELLETSD